MAESIATSQIHSGDEPAPDERKLKLFLTRQMRQLSAIAGRTKRSAARLALVAAMREGLLPAGARLPAEMALTDILGVSLGTVQAALRQLQQTGTIVRRRGDGTRVASLEPLDGNVWHFRFKNKQTGHPLRFQRQRVEITEVSGSGVWSAYLGEADRFVCVRRWMTMSDRSLIFAEMYLADGVAAGLAEIDPAELDTVNIRPYLEEAFGVVTAAARHSVQTRSIEAEEAGAFGLAPELLYFEIHAKAHDAHGRPVYFQRIFADCASYVLDF